MMKKRIAALLAFAMAVSFLPTVTMADSASTPEVTVVGKRITDGDPYFEISLEVNGKYEDYSAVNVVLEYDPAIIVPAASWDEGAGPADMKENTTWATRRALPTLGKETWSSHIALAYQTETEYDTDGTTVKTPSKGYLYLGAEYPGETANKADSESGGDEETPADDPGEEDSADADTDPHQNPVVVARFMYAAPTKYPSGTAEDIADERANTKEKLEALWQTGEYPAKAAATAADHWDNDWSKNKILTIAPDDIAFESPAQFPFAYYNANFEERAYMHTFPTAAPTTNPSASPATTSVPTAVHTVYANGSRIAETDRLKDTDINVVLGQGKSAKLTGGLSLSDIYVILFFDWDNSLIGTLTSGIGVDATEDVHKYVEKKFIHPDLRTDKVNYDSLSATERRERKNNYRGEYPHEKPDSGNPLAKTGAYPDGAEKQGSDYPLTNKLDYCFAGKTFVDEDNPYVFAYGWTQVLPTTPDYSDTTEYPGVLPQVLPKGMEDTLTAATVFNQATIGKKPDIDASGNLVDATDTIPDWIQCDFSNVTAENLEGSDGNLYVKAVYECGELLGKNTSGGIENEYNTVGPATIEPVGTATSTTSTYGISFLYERLNKFGHGVSRINSPSVNMALKQVGASASTPIELKVDNGEKISVMLTPTNAVDTVGYQLREVYNSDVVVGDTRSVANGIDNDVFKLQGTSGIIYKFNLEDLLDNAYKYAMDEITTGTTYANSSAYNATPWTTAATYSGLRLFQTATNAKTTNITQTAKIKIVQKAIVDLVRDTVKSGANYKNIDWYELQYYILKITTKTKTVTFTDDVSMKKEARDYIQASANMAEVEYLK